MMLPRPFRSLAFLLPLLAFAPAPAADPKPEPAPKPVLPKSPREEQATFRVPKGFKVELVASEPDVIDPVAMAFDERGRIFVAEMRGYPNAGVATGTITSGRIRMLVDEDGDGVYEKSTLFAEGLRFPTGVMPWKGGLLVANAPELLYLEDTDGDGKADVKRVLYTGFDLSNIQQLVNSLQWGLDNWVYGCAGSKGGTVHSAEKPDAAPVTLRNRGIRFHPDRPGSLEPTSGGGQYGLAPDDDQHWFTATNSQHLRAIILPDHYLRRNPYLAVSAVTLDIPDHGAACKVHRVSPFEAWRVERTTRRASGPDSKRFSPTELVPGGFITSACSPVVYRADLFPAQYRSNTFVCDPANNLIHRDILEPKGSTFVAKRGDVDCEFLASMDNWFRPVHLMIGPDGALYVLDFYREVIETPLSLPEDIKKKLNLESRGRGRIWRIAPEGFKAAKLPDLRKARGEELVALLDSPNITKRLMAQRLLVERQDKSVVPALEKLASGAKTAPGRAHALWTLDGLGALKEGHVLPALSDREAGVREQALRLAEHFLPKSAALAKAVLPLADDPSSHVRLQAAFTLGYLPPETARTALASLLLRPDADTWLQTAALSSARNAAPDLIEVLTEPERLKAPPASLLPLLTRLGVMVGAQADDEALGRVLKLLGQRTGATNWQPALLEGLGQGSQNTAKPLSRLWDRPTPALAGPIEQAVTFFRSAATTARDEKKPLAERVASVRLLAYGPFAVAGPGLKEILVPQSPAELQSAAIRALNARTEPAVAETVLASWPGYSPTLRREALEVLFARPDRLGKLLDAVEKKQVLAAHLDPARVEQLRKHPNAALRQRAAKLLAGQVLPDRQKVVDSYRDALELKPDLARGKAAFQKHCAVCHRLEGVGVEVGPDLVAVLRNKSREALLIDMLDPSREVDPRYVNYRLITESGQTYTGMLAVETPASITLRRAERVEDTILRSQIEQVQATTKSLMPEEFEKLLSKQDVADLIAYLQEAGTPKK